MISTKKTKNDSGKENTISTKKTTKKKINLYIRRNINQFYFQQLVIICIILEIPSPVDSKQKKQQQRVVFE